MRIHTMRRLMRVAAALALVATSGAHAQLDNMQNAPGSDWRIITTEHYDVIYPAAIERDAQRVANLAEHVYRPVSRSLGVEPERTPIILTNQMSEPNGYVTLGPRRSVWFGTPPSSGLAGPIEWYNTLAVHELRHVAQFDAANTGLTKIASILFGDVGRMVFSNISVPGWFWEGDAVGTETALSKGGRGRLPEFDMEVRALLGAGRRYSYHKALLGSFADRYPNHYVLGYLMTTHVKRRYGTEAWREILEKSANWSFSPTALSWAMSSVIDRSAPDVYEEAMDELDSLWKKQLSGLAITPVTRRNERDDDDWTNYVTPAPLPDGSILAQRYSMDDPFELVRIRPDGREERIERTASYGSAISGAGNRVVWSEYTSDPRWGMRSYSNIRLVDLEEGSSRLLTSGARLTAPTLSRDGATLAAVEFDEGRSCSLVLVDQESGAITRRIPSPDGDFIHGPLAFTDDGRSIVATATGLSGKRMIEIELESGKVRELIARGWEELSNPVVHGNWVLYGSPYSGIDNIYALDRTTLRRYQVTSRPIGAFAPAISRDGRTLYFSDYTADGYDLVSMPLDTARFRRIESVEVRDVAYYQPIVAQEAGDVLGDVPNVRYESKPYGGASTLFNVHSWFLLPHGAGIGAGVSSLNLLNTLGVDVGYDYNWNEKTHGVSASVSYAGLYPIIDAIGSYGGRASAWIDDRDSVHDYSWREASAGIGVRLPLDLSSGVHGMGLELAATGLWRKISGLTHRGEFDQPNGTLFPVTWSLSWGHSTGGWLRSLYPEWGEQLDLSYTHTPFGGDIQARMAHASATVVTPGLLANHSLVATGGYERQWTDDYRFQSGLSFPRGYESRYHPEIATASLQYHFPIAYPDLAIGSLLYFKRVKGNLFGDYAEGRDEGRAKVYRSVGFELSTEVSLFTLPFFLDIGVRGTFVPEVDRMKWEFLTFGAAF